MKTKLPKVTIITIVIMFIAFICIDIHSITKLGAAKYDIKACERYITLLESYVPSDTLFDVISETDEYNNYYLINNYE